MYMLKTTFALSLLLLAGCEPPGLIKNPLVDRWCGDHPCSWEVKGEIARTSTWHKKDYAVEFVSDHAQISQLNATLSGDYHKCFSFTMLANVDKNTKLFLELDFLDDAEIEFSQRIPPGDWERRMFLITPPTWFKGVRFIVRKEGPGHAELAQLSASSPNPDAGYSDEDTPLCTKPPLELRNRPHRAPCDGHEQCLSQDCVDDRCTECSSDKQCAIGICCEGSCSACCGDTACAEGKVCKETRCLADVGWPCFLDWDCASGLCCGLQCEACCNDANCNERQTCEKEGSPPLNSCRDRLACADDSECGGGSCIEGFCD